ncbi:glycosyltransferase family 31 protein [Aspergillus undulatus]|uniref:glycosyltransferase family 31 protein n=1 Tax=Aspergillus undulatus TaxID=1810928 RepID=UPI003CCD21D1
MRPPDSWLNVKPRKTVWVALAAICLACTSLLLFYQYEDIPLSANQPVSPILDASNSTSTNFNNNAAEAVTEDTSNNGNANASNNITQYNPSNAVQGDRRCQAFSDPGNIVFVIKTGATEVYEKLPTQLLTTLGCVQDFLLFSDLDEQIGPYRIRDTLADFNATLKETLPDFELYRLQHEFRRTNQDMASLKGDKAWKLDKYKFLHLVEKAWLERPNRDWYFFFETDTYIVWTNLILWMQRISPPTEALYLGSIAYFMNDPFAHGGSGFLISGELLKQFIGDGGLANKYDDSFTQNCCGDSVLANTIQKELDLQVQQMFPQINGEKPSTLPFGPTHWCQPVVTMHHLHPRERTAIFDFEQARPDLTKPLTFAELSHLPFPSNSTSTNSTSTSTSTMRTYEEDWDNMSNIRISFAGSLSASLETCRDACAGLEQCFQWRYNTDGECEVSTQAFRMGGKKMPDEDGKRWFSGWNTELIERWREDHPCEEVLWVEPKPVAE